MTIPSLMGSTNGLEYAAGAKKAMSVLSQAATMNYTNEGWDFNGDYDDMIVDILESQLKVVKNDNSIWTTTNPSTKNDTVQLADGMIITVPEHPTCTVASPCVAYVDVNGFKGPNTLNTPTSVGSNCNLSDIFKLKLYDQDAVIADDAVAKCVNKK